MMGMRFNYLKLIKERRENGIEGWEKVVLEELGKNRRKCEERKCENLDGITFVGLA